MPSVTNLCDSFPLHPAGKMIAAATPFTQTHSGGSTEMYDSLERLYTDMTLTPNMIILHEDGCLYKWLPASGWVLFETPHYHEVLVDTYVDEDDSIACVFEVSTTIEAVEKRCIQRQTPCCSPVRRSPPQSEKEEAVFEFEMPKRKRGRPKKEKRNTRPTTKYNEFIKDVMPNVKEQFPNMTNKERLMECVKLWREHKTTTGL
jgi:hypothetical protein